MVYVRFVLSILFGWFLGNTYSELHSTSHDVVAAVQSLLIAVVFLWLYLVSCLADLRRSYLKE